MTSNSVTIPALAVAAFTAGFVFGCGDGSSHDAGGSSGSGGGQTSSGSSASGGVSGSGGSTASGGSSAWSGTGATSGSTASGGLGASGSNTASGGGMASGGASSTGGAFGTGGIGTPPPATDGGLSVYSVACEADSRPCGYPVASCLGIHLAEGGVGYTCSNFCNTDADCSDAPSGARAEAGCVAFTSAKHCVLVCRNGTTDRTCPAGMSCYEYPRSGIGYCLWL